MFSTCFLFDISICIGLLYGILFRMKKDKISFLEVCIRIKNWVSHSWNRVRSRVWLWIYVTMLPRELIAVDSAIAKPVSIAA